MSDIENSPELAGVLFVDDEANILRSLQRLLVDEDFPVFTAPSGDEGLLVLGSNPNIGLIVSDQRMPGMNGAEFLARAREMAPESLRILLTGYSDIEATIDAINRGGAYRYVTKPWNDEDLLQIIRDGLRNYTLTRENKRLATIVRQQNEELKEWNGRLKSRVLQQTTEIREKNQELHKKNQSLSKVYQDMIVAFSGLIELYSKALRNHSGNVAELALRAARAMELPAEETEKIYIAARLHDIGELGTAEGLLYKPLDELQGAKLQEYMQHAVRGQTAIDTVEELRPVGVLIRHHHEHFDGSGFPDGLRGEDIPLGSRIIAMADYADRTRQFTQEPDVAKIILPRLEKLLGKHFDPALFPYFCKPIEELYRQEKPPTHQIEKVIKPHLLQMGMILAEDLYSGTGLLLLNKGTCLDKDCISSIRRYDQLDPFEKGVRVLTED
jgi:response regulator RpfG family c-di-GMP phosphodiesterase